MEQDIPDSDRSPRSVHNMDTDVQYVQSLVETDMDDAMNTGDNLGMC